MNARKFLSVTAAAISLSFAAGAQAAIISYFGEDLNNSNSVRKSPTPLANGASAAFQSGLSGVSTELFESFRCGQSAPLNLSFTGSAGTIGATLSGGGGNIACVTGPGTNGFGRYPISGEKYWEVDAGSGGNFVINFSEAVAAFGFYGVDIGDFGGQVQLQLVGGSTVTVNVGNTIGSGGSTDGSVLFFGIIGTTASDVFTSVRFLTTTGQGDVFAFDNMTIGDLRQVTVPEPASLALLGLALAGLGVASRRRVR